MLFLYLWQISHDSRGVECGGEKGGGCCDYLFQHVEKKSPIDSKKRKRGVLKKNLENMGASLYMFFSSISFSHSFKGTHAVVKYENMFIEAKNVFFLK